MKNKVIEEVEEILECINPFAATETEEEIEAAKLVFVEDGKEEKAMEER